MNRSEEALRRAQIAFQGRMMAAATHELQNHLAVIKEYSGLASDLLNVKKSELERSADRCREIAGNIGERALLAAAATDILNRFAHRADLERCSFPVNDIVEELAALLQRQASQKRVFLETGLSADAPVIRSDPALIQFLLYLLIEPLLESLAEEGRIVISTAGRSEGPAIVSLAAEGEMREPDGTLHTGAALGGMCLEMLGSSLSRNNGTSGRFSLSLALPSMPES